MIHKRVMMGCCEERVPACEASENVMTRTVPSGKFQPRDGVMSMCAVPGRARKRSLWAPSDHNGELTEYGIKAGCGLLSRTDTNNPVSLGAVGDFGGLCGLGGDLEREK